MEHHRRVDRRRRGHRARPHTADIIWEAWGPDLPTCCEEAVAGLVETYIDGGDIEIVAERRTHLAPQAPDAALLAVLEEVIFTLDTADDVPIGAVIRSEPGGGLVVVMSLANAGRLRSTGAVPKAISRSGLDVTTTPDRVSCRFLVDV